MIFCSILRTKSKVVMECMEWKTLECKKENGMFRHKLCRNEIYGKNCILAIWLIVSLLQAGSWTFLWKQLQDCRQFLCLGILLNLKELEKNCKAIFAVYTVKIIEIILNHLSFYPLKKSPSSPPPPKKNPPLKGFPTSCEIDTFTHRKIFQV